MSVDNSGLPDGWSQRPAVARIDDCLTGGFNNFPADRQLASRLVQEAPWFPDMVRDNRRYRNRVVTVLAREFGIRQYLDLGCGLPSLWSKKLQRHDPPLTYESAASVHADARVVYVDNDPVVYAHARTTLDVNSSTAAVFADIRQIGELLDDPAVRALDIRQPTGVLLNGVLHWASDESAHIVTAELREWLADGSAISVTHATTDMAPETMRALVGHYAEAGIDYRPRTLEQISELLAPWEILAPGIVPTAQWRPEDGTTPGENPGAYAALATPTRSGP